MSNRHRDSEVKSLAVAYLIFLAAANKWDAKTFIDIFPDNDIVAANEYLTFTEVFSRDVMAFLRFTQYRDTYLKYLIDNSDLIHEDISNINIATEEKRQS